MKEERVKRLREKWEPALQKLVNDIGEKFSAAFDRKLPENLSHTSVDGFLLQASVVQGTTT